MQYFLKIAKISGWLLVMILVLYFITGYGMTDKYGMSIIMSHLHVRRWHKYLALPFMLFLLLHVTPYYVARKQIMRLVLIFLLVICLPIASVYAVNEFQKQSAQQVTHEQGENRSVRCNKCPNKCLIKPNQTGKCGRYKNVDGRLQSTQN